MEIRVLKYFLAVAREESISGAAEVLHVSQPTLSRQLMDMEEHLGKKLFVRGNRKISLTEEGMFLRKRAQEIVDLVEKTESAFYETDEMVSGDIFIGGGETDAMRVVARVVKKLQQTYPNIRYHLFSGNADDVTERLDRGLLDFGIVIEPADVKKYDFLKLPATDTWGLLLPKESPLSQKQFITPVDLRNIPLLCSRQSMTHNAMSGWLGEDFETLNIVATYNLIYNAALMVDEGVGYALCLDKLVNTSTLSHLHFAPLSPKIEAGLSIVWKKYQVFSKAAQIFLGELQQEINQ